MFQSKSFFCKKKKKCTILVIEIDNGGGYTYVGTKDIWKLSVSTSQVYYNPKSLKTKVSKYMLN